MFYPLIGKKKKTSWLSSGFFPGLSWSHPPRTFSNLMESQLLVVSTWSRGARSNGRRGLAMSGDSYRFLVMGVSIVMGVPQNGWFIKENPTINGWFGANPMNGNTQMIFTWCSNGWTIDLEPAWETLFNMKAEYTWMYSSGCTIPWFVLLKFFKMNHSHCTVGSQENSKKCLVTNK